FGKTVGTFDVGTFEFWLCIAFVAWLLLTAFASALQRILRRFTGKRYFGGSRMKSLVPGLTGLLATILLGLPLPLLLYVAGEGIERPEAAVAQLLDRVRYLDVREKVLLGKSAVPVTPATIADLRSVDPAKRETGERSIERIDLQNRSLRGADLVDALMPKADLRGAQLQGALLED